MGKANTFQRTWNDHTIGYDDHSLGRNAMVRFVLNDGTELHVCLVEDGLEVRSSGSISSSIIVRPCVSNEVIIRTEKHEST